MITDYFLLLVLMLLMVPSQSRRLGKSSKAEKTEESELPQDLTDETETQQANQDRELNPCLETLVVYSDPNDNFFDPDLMQLVMLDVSTCILSVEREIYLCSVHLCSLFTFSFHLKWNHAIIYRVQYASTKI